jgi:transketolase
VSDLFYVPPDELRRARERGPEHFAAACRINVLYMVQRAGSGHLGSSFSCMDVLVRLYLDELGPDDLFFSSKGHDVPAQYAVLAATGRLDFDRLHALRRLGGLPGHPDVGTPGMVANSGSLGMGISKAMGMLRARALRGLGGRAFVLTGDGELQEGQIWEALLAAAAARMGALTVIVDHNKIQSDTWVARVSDLGELAHKLAAFGWRVARCDGHDFDALARAFGELRQASDRPAALIADTVKGRGVSFMERFGGEDRFYGFHSGAPDGPTYARALDELVAAAGDPRLETVPAPIPAPAPAGQRPRQRLVDAYARELLAQAARRPDLVVLDADLVKDCGLAEFARRYPERFIECGIAEQHMVSQAGGLALQGMLPVVHSFAAFLSARPNEQIYCNATERSKVIYVATLAGLLPGGPGHSHQAVRDISSLGAVPDLTMVAPCSELETAAALEWCVHRATGSCYLRLSSIPAELPFELPADWRFEPFRGTVLCDGDAAVVYAYGPVMVAQAHGAASRLRERGVAVRVVALPWLNRVDAEWLVSTALPWVFTIDDHYLHGGQGDMILTRLAEAGALARARRFGVGEIPACGQNHEVLCHHRLDATSLAEEMFRCLRP